MAIELIKNENSLSFTTPTVKSVNGKIGNVILTAEDIGAIGSEELDTAIETALTEAKESGAFDGADGKDGQDGADGKDYVLTDADKQEIAEMVEVTGSGEAYKELEQSISEAETDIDNISNRLFVKNLINLKTGDYEAWTPANCNGTATVEVDNLVNINHISHDTAESSIVIPLDAYCEQTEGQTYTLSIQNISFENYTGAILLRLLDPTHNQIKDNNDTIINLGFPTRGNYSKTFISSGKRIGYISITFNSGTEVTNLNCNIQLEANDTMTSFQSPDQMLKLEPLDKSVTEAKLTTALLNKINTPLTEAYKTEIANQVIELLPNGDEVSY